MKNDKVLKIVWTINFIISIIAFVMVTIVLSDTYEIYNETYYLPLLIIEIINIIFGVLFLPFIFGILVRLSVKWVYQYRSFLMIVILSIVFYTLVNTFQRFFLYRMSQLLLLYVLYHYGKKKKYLNKVNQL